MKTLSAWLADYSQSHQNPTNQRIHKICVPAILWSVLAVLWSVKLTQSALGNAAVVCAAALSVYYISLSRAFGLIMVAVFVGMLVSCAILENLAALPVWVVGGAVFVVAWIGQFVGHAIEGRKPSFIQDLQFLLIGPLWTLAHVVKKKTGND